MRDILPDLVIHLSLLIVNKNVSLGFIQILCTHDFSRVSFAAELSTKLVYNSVFVKDYDYIFIYLLYIHIHNIYKKNKASLFHKN